jgi:hypothetical protein
MAPMGSGAALAHLRAAAADCTKNRAGFTEWQRAEGMVIIDELRSLFATPEIPVRHAAERGRPSLLEGLPPELLVAVLRLLDKRSLVRFASTCRPLYEDRPRPMTPVEEALMQRAAERGLSIPRSFPERFRGWVPLLLRHGGLAEGQCSVAAGCAHSLLIDSDGRLLRYGGDPDGDTTPRLFPSVGDVYFQSVSSSQWVSLALSEEGDVRGAKLATPLMRMVGKNGSSTRSRRSSRSRSGSASAGFRRALITARFLPSTEPCTPGPAGKVARAHLG